MAVLRRVGAQSRPSSCVSSPITSLTRPERTSANSRRDGGTAAPAPGRWRMNGGEGRTFTCCASTRTPRRTGVRA
jgi:hypothetical protein